MIYQSLILLIKDYVLDYKPTIHFHSLRHGFATYCYECGMEIEQIQVLLGHSDIQTTMVYVKMNPVRILQAHTEKVIG